MPGPLGGLGLLGPSMFDTDPNNPNAVQNDLLMAYGKALRDPKATRSVDQTGSRNPYALASPFQGVHDIMRSIAGDRVLGNAFQQQNAGRQRSGLQLPVGPQTPPVVPNNNSAYYGGEDSTNPTSAPEAGAGNNTPQLASNEFGGDFEAAGTPPARPVAQPSAGQARITSSSHTDDDVNYWSDQGGFPAVSAAALAHRRQNESGNDYHAVNDNDNGRVSIAGMQWNEERAVNLARFARRQGINIPNGNVRDPAFARQLAAAVPPDVQRAFVVHELNTTERRHGDALRAARTPQEAYRAVLNYIRPQNQNISNNDIAAITNLTGRVGRMSLGANADGGQGDPADAGGGPVQVAQAQPRPPRGPTGAPSSANRPNYPGARHPLFNPELDFQPEYPDPISPLHGMSPQDMQALAMQHPSVQEMMKAEFAFRNTPQYTEVPGQGKRWTVPSTGQTGWIPTPQYREIQSATGDKITTVTIFDRYGRSRTYIASPARGSLNTRPGSLPAGSALDEEAERSNLGAGGITQQPIAEPLAEPAAINPTEEIVAPEGTEPILPPGSVPPLGGQSAVTPPVQVAQASGPAPIRATPAQTQRPPTSTDVDEEHPFMNPFFTGARDIAAEHHGRLKEEERLAGIRVEPIETAIQRGNEAVATREVVNLLKELENVPDTGRIWTGPDAARVLAIQQRVNGALQAAGVQPLFPPGVVASAEMLTKISTYLASVAARQLTNRPTQFDFQTFLKANPDISNSPPGRRMLTMILGQMADRDKELGDAAARAAESPAARRNWTRTRDAIIDRHVIRYNGTVMDHNAVGMGVNPTNGDIVVTRPINGMIVNGYRYMGETGNWPQSQAKGPDGRPLNWQRVR